MSTFHRSGENRTSEFPRGARRQCLVEEYPRVSSVSGTRTLENCGHAQLLAGVMECARIADPCFFVEIHGQKPAGFVLEKRINANGLFPVEMVPYNRVGQREEPSGVLIDFFRSSGLLALIAFQSFSAAGE